MNRYAILKLLYLQYFYDCYIVWVLRNRTAGDGQVKNDFLMLIGASNLHRIFQFYLFSSKYKTEMKGTLFSHSPAWYCFVKLWPLIALFLLINLSLFTSMLSLFICIFQLDPSISACDEREKKCRVANESSLFRLSDIWSNTKAVHS